MKHFSFNNCLALFADNAIIDLATLFVLHDNLASFFVKITQMNDEKTMKVRVSYFYKFRSCI
jgi:hypothetical protein